MDETAASRRTGLLNEQDDAVLAALRAAPLGTLYIDRFADVLRLNGTSGETAMMELRGDVSMVYLRASLDREAHKASYAELEAAESAIGLLWKAAGQLEVVTRGHAGGLHRGFAVSTSDPKGLDEATEFSTICSGAKVAAVRLAAWLLRRLNEEREKPTPQGKPKQRLRILTEGLAELWFTGTDKTISPSVRSNRRDNAPAVVHGRTGLFLDFAKGVLCGLDSFSPSEVESAVTNVAKSLSRSSGV